MWGCVHKNRLLQHLASCTNFCIKYELEEVKLLHMLFSLSFGDSSTFGMFLHEQRKEICGYKIVSEKVRGFVVPSHSQHLLNYLIWASNSSLGCFFRSLFQASFFSRLFFFSLLARVEMFQQFVCFWIRFSCLNLKIMSSVHHYSSNSIV